MISCLSPGVSIELCEECLRSQAHGKREKINKIRFFLPSWVSFSLRQVSQGDLASGWETIRSWNECIFQEIVAPTLVAGNWQKTFFSFLLKLLVTSEQVVLVFISWPDLLPFLPPSSLLVSTPKNQQTRYLRDSGEWWGRVHLLGCFCPAPEDRQDIPCKKWCEWKGHRSVEGAPGNKRTAALQVLQWHDRPGEGLLFPLIQFNILWF